jgi:cell fate regulator YaaT (PSP1 superfamily)
MSCSSGGCSTGGGCSTSSGGCSSGGCSSGGCNKLNSFDWLGNMELNTLNSFDIVEVRFKNGRKEFFRNSKGIELFTGDPIVVEVQSGHHIGNVSMQGEIVRLQMRKKEVLNNDEIKTIYRKASTKDLEKFEQARNRESSSLYRTREIIEVQKLDMKLSDVEFQADNTKVTFYYSAEDRVDFRELIKMLATEFKVRIEMKQISLRHEAARLGGIGSCGRELCCSTWLTDFKNVNTSAARYQNLSLNPSKLSGQCGRLKCCLNYELDTYLDALKDIPEVEIPLKTAMGNATLQKTDIFKKVMWFGFQEETTWYPLTVDRVTEILEMNKLGKTPATLQSNEIEIKDDRVLIKEKEELSRFDDKFKSKKKKKKKKGGDDIANRSERPQLVKPSQTAPESAPQRTSQQPVANQHNQGNNNPNRNQNKQGGNQNIHPQHNTQRNNNPGGNQQRPANNQQNTPRQPQPDKPKPQLTKQPLNKPNPEQSTEGNKHQLTKAPRQDGIAKTTENREPGHFPQRQNNGKNPNDTSEQNNTAN